MNQELVFLLRADIDIQSAFERYDSYQEGRGYIFLRHLDAAFLLLKRFPEIGIQIRHPHRRLLVEGFPYGIFYTIEGGRIIVEAIQDLRQDPDALKRLLE